jgi:hypothetical protein
MAEVCSDGRASPTAIDAALNEEVPAAGVELVTLAERQAVVNELGVAERAW